MTADPRDHPILFFDGQCLLCQRSVRWVLRKDRNRVFCFATLTSEVASKIIPSDHPARQMDTVVLADEEGLHVRSRAVFRTLAKLPTLWRWLLIFRILPRALPDWVYHQVAQRRYHWFGKDETCSLPAPDQRARFLE